MIRGPLSHLTEEQHEALRRALRRLRFAPRTTEHLGQFCVRAAAENA